MNCHMWLDVYNKPQYSKVRHVVARNLNEIQFSRVVLPLDECIGVALGWLPLGVRSVVKIEPWMRYMFIVDSTFIVQKLVCDNPFLDYLLRDNTMSYVHMYKSNVQMSYRDLQRLYMMHVKTSKWKMSFTLVVAKTDDHDVATCCCVFL